MSIAGTETTLDAHESPDQQANHYAAADRERLWVATAKVSRMLLKATNVMAAIPEVLRELGEAAQVDRTALALAEIGPFGERWLAIKGEWLAEGVADDYPNVPRVWEARKTDCFCSQLKTGRSVYVCHDQALDDTSIASSFAKSSMIVPFLVDGEYLGVIGFDSCRQPRQYDPAIVSALEIAASVIGAALHREQLIETMRIEREHAAEQRVAELAKSNATLRANLERLATAMDMVSFLNHMLLEACRQLDAAAGTVIMLSPAGNEWRVLANVRDSLVEEPPFAKVIPVESIQFDQLSAHGEPIHLEVDLNESINWPGVLEYRLREGHKSTYVLPLVFGGHTIGIIALSFRHHRPLSPILTESIVALAQQATLALGLKRLGISAKNAAVLAERNRIGREIHDGLAQVFTGILMQLGAAEEMAKSSPLLPVLQRIGDIAREGLQEARRSVLALQPDEARTAGLDVALKQLAQRSTIAGRITTHFAGLEAPTGLAPEKEHALLRIAQEAVSNAIRHAQPTHIHITLSTDKDHIVLSVSDDGCGMELRPEQSAQQGFGLNNMRERAVAIGGRWRVESRPKAGTHISVHVPQQRN